MKHKVTVIITRSEIGGAQKYVLSMIDQLNQEFDFNVITGSDSYLSEALRSRNISVTIIKQIDSINFIVAIFKLRSFLAKNPTDILNTHSTLASFYGRLASMGIATPLIYSVHGWFFMNQSSNLRRKLGPLAEKLLSRLTSFWITETKFDQQIGYKCGAINSLEKSIVIPNGIPEPVIKEARSDRTNKIEIAFIGRISHQKNPTLAIKVLALLPEKFSLTLYCDNAGDLTITTLIGELGLWKRIKLIDTEQNTAAIIHQHDLLLVTSRYEGMPLSIIEAMSAGLPILSSNVCGLNELVINNRNGYLIDTQSPSEYASKIQFIFSNTRKLKDMKKQSRVLFEERHTSSEMADKLSKVFTRVIAARE